MHVAPLSFGRLGLRDNRIGVLGFAIATFALFADELDSPEGMALFAIIGAGVFAAVFVSARSIAKRRSDAKGVAPFSKYREFPPYKEAEAQGFEDEDKQATYTP